MVPFHFHIWLGILGVIKRQTEESSSNLEQLHCIPLHHVLAIKRSPRRPPPPQRSTAPQVTIPATFPLLYSGSRSSAVDLPNSSPTAYPRLHRSWLTWLLPHWSRPGSDCLSLLQAPGGISGSEASPCSLSSGALSGVLESPHCPPTTRLPSRPLAQQGSGPSPLPSSALSLMENHVVDPKARPVQWCIPASAVSHT